MAIYSPVLLTVKFFSLFASPQKMLAPATTAFDYFTAKTAERRDT